MRSEIIISGFGGQGVLFTGALLAHAAMSEGKQVTLFPSYGAEIRGGVAKSQIIISDDPIGAPAVYHPDILLSLNKLSYEKFSPLVKNGGSIFVNTSIFQPVKREDVEFFEVPANALAEKSGSVLAANIVMLGALIAKKGILKGKSVEDAIPEMLKAKKGFWDVNKKAFREGLKTFSS